MLSKSQQIEPELLQYLSSLDGKYRIIETIGQGRYAKVKYAIDMKSNERYAIKIMRNNHMNSQQKLDMFLKEVEILSEVKHKNIIKIKYIGLDGVYQKQSGTQFKVVYFVMKLAEYGELYNFFEQTPKFHEKLARHYFRQLLHGIEYLHKRGISHLDIKPENLLIDKNFNLKIADFGFAQKLLDANNKRIAFKSSIPVGSPEYNPPEISNKSQGQTYVPEQVDIFASGCFLFLMVMRSAPFANTNINDQYYQRLCSSDTQKFWKIFQSLATPSCEFKDLIEQILNKSTSNRLSLEQIYNHPWFQGEFPTHDEVEKDMLTRINILEINGGDARKNKLQFKLTRLRDMIGPNSIKFQNIKMDSEFEVVKQPYLHLIQQLNQKILNKRTRMPRKKKKNKSEESDNTNRQMSNSSNDDQISLRSDGQMKANHEESKNTFVIKKNFSDHFNIVDLKKSQSQDNKNYSKDDIKHIETTQQIRKNSYLTYTPKSSDSEN